MKNLFKIIPVLLCMLFMFSSCGKKGYIEINSSELYSTNKAVTAKFEITNHQKEKIENLSIQIEAFDKNNNSLGFATAKYSLPVDPDSVATLSASVNKESKKAVAVSYEYNLNGEKISGKFENSPEATQVAVTEADFNYETREELANALIKDIKRQFMLQKFEAHGYYESDSNSLVIAAYTSKSYNDCIYENSIDSSGYKALAESMATMSKTCLEEFEIHGFSDVQISVGLLSKDERILISATNGTIVENLN